MTITATPDAAFVPPRVTVQMELPPNSVMETVELYRRQGGTRELVRSQPVAGFDQRTVYDYECPYEVPVTYEWATQFLDGTTFSTLLNETWANLAAWTVTNGADGNWAASGGNLVYVGPASDIASIRYNLATARYRMTFQEPPNGIDRIDFGGFYVDVQGSRLVAGASIVAIDPGVGAWSINVTNSSVTLVTTAGTYSLNVAVFVTKIEYLRPRTQKTITNNLLSNVVGGASWVALGSVVDSTGRIFVLASEGSGFPSARQLGVHVFTAAGAYLKTQIFAEGTGNGQFALKLAKGFAIDSANRIIIGDPNSYRIQRFTITGTGAATALVYLDKVGSEGTGNGQWSNGIDSITTDSANNVYVLEQYAAQIQKFTSSLVYSTKWGSTGAGNSQMYTPTHIASDGTSIYVVDQGNAGTSTLGRLRKFTNVGGFLWRTTILADFTSLPRGLVVDNTGQVYVGSGKRGIDVYNGTTGAKSATIAESVSHPNNIRTLGISSDRKTVWAFGRSDSYTADRIALANATLGDVQVEGYGGAQNLDESSAEITLTPSAAWIIHPSSPSKSIPIDRDDMDRTNLETIGQVTQRSTASIHEILGQQKAIHVTTGPRRADELALTLTTETVADRKQIEFLLADETPLLIRIPPSWDIDFTDDFYAVGDVGIARAMQFYGINARVFTLPLRAVESPIVGVENVGWSWAALASEFASWDAELLAFASWSDLLTNTRRGA